MTSELKPGEYIAAFGSGGPKNYAFKTFNTFTNETKTVCKVRGIAMNYSPSRLVNFDVIKDMILARDETDIVTVHTD